jgi:hypothetical protein
MGTAAPDQSAPLANMDVRVTPHRVSMGIGRVLSDHSESHYTPPPAATPTHAVIEHIVIATAGDVFAAHDFAWARILQDATMVTWASAEHAYDWAAVRYGVGRDNFGPFRTSYDWLLIDELLAEMADGYESWKRYHISSFGEPDWLDVERQMQEVFEALAPAHLRIEDIYFVLDFADIYGLKAIVLWRPDEIENDSNQASHADNSHSDNGRSDTGSTDSENPAGGDGSGRAHGRHLHIDEQDYDLLPEADGPGPPYDDEGHPTDDNDQNDDICYWCHHPFGDPLALETQRFTGVDMQTFVRQRVYVW